MGLMRKRQGRDAPAPCGGRPEAREPRKRLSAALVQGPAEDVEAEARAVIVDSTSCSHEYPCPSGRAGRTAPSTAPTSTSLSCPSPPSRASPAATSASI
jgi:hypothetical protein